LIKLKFNTEHALVIFTWLSIQVSSAESSISNSHRNWEKGNKNQEIENVQTCFDGDLKLCTIVQIQLMNFCKQWIEMNENRMGLEKDEWLTSFDEPVHTNRRSEKNKAC
jgi:hypothetical protein